MDSDILVIRSLQPIVSFLLSKSTQNFSFWSCEDLPYFPRSFNMGMFAIQPEPNEYARLMHLLYSDDLYFPEEWAEQGFLNVVYKDTFQMLPIHFTLNMAAWLEEYQDLWNKNAHNVQALHFTNMKAWWWRCAWTDFAPLCYLWWNKHAMEFHRIDSQRLNF